MDVVVLGTAGPDGIPVAGCACPACLAAGTDPATARSPTAALLDGDRRLTVADPVEQTGADGVRVLWLPDAVGLDDAALAGLVPGPPARVAVVGGPAPADAARALARLRAAGAVDGGTRCVLVGHRHDWPPPDEVLLRARHWGLAVPADGDRVDGPPAGSSGGQRLPRRTLVLGGTRSGKSALAEDLLAAEPAVVYLAATDPAGADLATTHRAGTPGGDTDRGGTDGEWARRVAAHRGRRPAWWRTVESTDLAATIEAARAGGVPGGGAAVLLDSTGSWLAATLDAAGAWAGTTGWEQRYGSARDQLLQAWRGTPVPLVAVAEEVGGSLLPVTASGRLFTDELGRLHQLLAASSEQVLQCVAGRTVVVASPGPGRAASSTRTDPRAGA